MSTQATLVYQAYLAGLSAANAAALLGGVPLPIDLLAFYGVRVLSDATPSASPCVRTIVLGLNPVVNATAVAALEDNNSGSPVKSVTVSAAGSGYVVPPIVSFTGGRALAAGGALAPINFVAAASNPISSTQSAVIPAAQQVGDLIVVFVAHQDETFDETSVTDTAGNTYIRAITPFLRVGLGKQSVYFANAGTPTPAGLNTVHVTFPATVNGFDMRVALYRGAGTGFTLDQTVSATGINAPLAAVTTTVPAEVVVSGCFVTGAVTALNVRAGFTSRLITPVFEGLCDDIVAGTGTYSGGYTDPCGPWICQTVSFFQNPAPALLVGGGVENMETPSFNGPAAAVAYLKVVSAAVVAGGTGYSAATFIKVEGKLKSSGEINPIVGPPEDVGVPAVLTPTIAFGVITGVTVASAGSGYVGIPKITVVDPTSGGGTGAVISVSMGVGVIAVLRGGSGYKPAPAVVLTPYFQAVFPPASLQAAPFRNLFTPIFEKALLSPVSASAPVIT